MADSVDTSLDIDANSTILYLEHVNFEHNSIDQTRTFYHSILGLTFDAGKTAFRDTTDWLNVGKHSQIHLPFEDYTNSIDGAISLTSSKKQCELLPSNIEKHRQQMIGQDISHSKAVNDSPNDAVDSLIKEHYSVVDSNKSFHRVTGPNKIEFRLHELEAGCEEQRAIAYALVKVPHRAMDSLDKYWQKFFDAKTE